MSAQIYPVQSYKPASAHRRYPLANAANQNQVQQPQTTPKKHQEKQKQSNSPPLPRQNTKTTPPSPPQVIRDKSGHFQFQRLGFLGEGGFARVYEVRDARGSRVACKVVTKTSLKTKKAKTKLYAEIKIHRSLEHPNIVNFQECFEDDENVYMTLELCTSGSLMDLLRRRRRFTEPEARFFSVQLIGACHYMHTHQVIHRDLKLGNLFLDGNMNVKVGDFGLAALIENPGERKKTICGTPNYIAPEVLFDTANGHSFEVDTWSIGVIIYTLLIGRPPFQTKEVKAIYTRIRDNDYEFPQERPVSSYAQALIQSILTPLPQERPSLHQIVDDEFFTRGTFPPAIPTSAHDTAPDFRHISRAASELNLKRVRRQALLDEDQITSIALPRGPQDDLVSMTSNDLGTRNVSIAQQEKEFQKAVQPGSPISALLNSAKRPLLRSTGTSGPAGNGGVKESPLFRKLQAASTVPSPLGKGVARARTATRTGGQELEALVEDEPQDERWEKEQLLKRKELEAQKARIVAQMAPVREEEREPEDDLQPQEVAIPPVKKELKRTSSSVKENRIPGTVAESKLKMYGFDAAAHVLTLAFDAKAVGRLFKDPREDPSLPLPEENVFIVSWVDYCNKYGMGYALTDGSVGVHFNDSTSLVLSADKQHFDTISARRSGSVYVRKSHTVDNYPEDIESKVYLLKHFERYIMDRLYGQYDYTFEDTQRTKGMCWVQKYLRMKHVIVFKLSHDVLQFNFYDHSKIILSSHGLSIIHIDKNYKLTRWTLADVMKIALQVAASPDDHGLDPNAVKFNQRLVDKLKYCKEVLVSIKTASKEGNDDLGAEEPVARTAVPSSKGSVAGSDVRGPAGLRLSRTSKASLR
ncbi:Cell cycle serine/threonine-protein kinase cdc5/MSD2 [Marasmius crinis-equi]|uniref:Serine/threonine-protein kinase n=1 Tax=Marasmius crinis-equi TaxID=585013 RepID=A0ABR3FVT0_9AGAR